MSCEFLILNEGNNPIVIQNSTFKINNSLFILKEVNNAPGLSCTRVEHASAARQSSRPAQFQ
ncbi:hypothetical protein PITCH_A330039 [uncultured Desulfobacterium sp.]|uniref:Uncharacterized protein n=1 Tax=uncultured Desulfobacterium sp. TaxID=201089 RepID=A0A445MZ32_9BACT|nr:hypothetical protein PITCH_A330039 [uncultured Desulfobacterium sp.]